MVALSQGSPDGSEAVSVAGDVYVTISGPFGDFHLAATGEIFGTDRPLALVPEPGASALLLCGLARGMRWRRRRVVE